MSNLLLLNITSVVFKKQLLNSKNSSPQNQNKVIKPSFKTVINHHLIVFKTLTITSLDTQMILQMNYFYSNPKLMHP
jgi:hypothetical protein